VVTITITRTHLLWLAGILATALVVFPATSWASHQFADVDDGNVFQADIAWLADAGITKGCNPPANTMYCPGANVTRQQMAAFMHRLATTQVVDAASVQGNDPEDLKGVSGWEVVSGHSDPSLNKSVADGEVVGIAAYCPEGKIVTGGGYSVTEGLEVNENYVGYFGEPVNAWWIRVVNNTGGNGNAKVHAICVDATP
jgi:hypothetical protein